MAILRNNDRDFPHHCTNSAPALKQLETCSLFYSCNALTKDLRLFSRPALVYSYLSVGSNGQLAVEVSRETRVYGLRGGLGRIRPSSPALVHGDQVPAVVRPGTQELQVSMDRFEAAYDQERSSKQ